jgi:leucyl aminopeptidase
MKNQLCFARIAGIETELLAVPAADIQISREAGARSIPALLTTDEKVKAAVADILASGEFMARANETLLLYAPAGLAARRLLIVGLGRQSKVNINSVRNAAGSAVRFAKPRGIRELVFAMPEIELSSGLCARAAVEGAIAGDFDPDTYCTSRRDQSIAFFTLACSEVGDKADLETSFTEGVIAGESQTFARALVNEPGNKLTPTKLGQRAAAMAAEVGLSCEVHSIEKIHELKMGAFWSVSQGSEEPPALIVLHYAPEGVTDGPVLRPTDKDPSVGTPVLGLVGKGITFDAGGISIKASYGMEKMKDDMAGGAAMLGAMRAIALLKPRVRVIAVICAAENMPGGKAQKPGDVQTAMPIALGKPGKTIEIINTDAEGRLVLADGLTYARQLGATHLIDAATLTGACIQALAAVYAGVLSNDEATYEKFVAALDISGEKFWRLPLGEEFAEMMKSDIADLKNSAGDPGDASTAAELLRVFVEDTPWIHLDIAGVAWMEENKPYMAKGPTGIAVRSILEWVRHF